LNNSSHAKGAHSKGSLIHDFCRDIAIVGNLFAHNMMRNPYFKAFTEGVIVNNLIYNPGRTAIQLGYSPSEWKGSKYEPQNCKVSIVGNVLYKGKDTKSYVPLVGMKGDVFMKDNQAFGVNGEKVLLMDGAINLLSEKPSWPENLKALPSKNVVDYVVNNAGARPRERDFIDKRIIRDFLNRTGKIINSQEEAGGYPAYKKTYRKLDIPERNLENWLKRFAEELE